MLHHLGPSPSRYSFDSNGTKIREFDADGEVVWRQQPGVDPYRVVHHDAGYLSALKGTRHAHNVVNKEAHRTRREALVPGNNVARGQADETFRATRNDTHRKDHKRRRPEHNPQGKKQRRRRT
jgi:hypothetical protein